MTSEISQKRPPQLVVALDFLEKNKAIGLAHKLASLAHPSLWVKVGLELFTAEGPAVVSALKSMGLKVFLDLKFHDIPNTVQGAVRSACFLGVDMCNIHASGGKRMAEAAILGLKEGVAEYGNSCLLLGVTVLTSTGQDEIKEDLTALALERAIIMCDAGLHGVVCSGHEVAAIKKVCGENFICLCPGIRPITRLSGHDAEASKSNDDQRRIMTPGEAVRAGADFLVVGRPVCSADVPVNAVLRILEEMSLAELT